MKSLISLFIIRYIVVFIVSFNFLFFCIHAARAQGDDILRLKPSSAEHIAFCYFNLAQVDPNITKLAVRNLASSAGSDDGQAEINRLQKRLGDTRPEQQYIIINDFVDFTAKQGPSGERLFVFPAFNAEFFHTARYQNTQFMVIPKGIENLNEVELSEDQINQFLHSFDQEPFIGYALHIRANYAAREKISLEDALEYSMISGDVAYLAFLDRNGLPIWQYKAPWYGETVKKELDTLYHKNGAATSQEIQSVNDEIKSMYKK
jgi:hypothetical protein